MVDNSPHLKTLWNMDEAVCKMVYSLKASFIISLKNWDLDNAYWTIRQLRMEIDSKLKPLEKEEVEQELKKIEKLRTLYLSDKTKQGDFYMSLEGYYIKLNRHMKQHGLYFREGDDPRRAIFKK